MEYSVADRVDEFGNTFCLKARAFGNDGWPHDISLWGVFFTTLAVATAGMGHAVPAASCLSL